VNSFYSQLFLALAIGSGIGFWWSSLRAREAAVAAAKLICQQRKVQFLDQTVALSGIRAVRLGTGSLGWRRNYRFEFTDDGARRDTASLTLDGNKLKIMSFPFTLDEEGARVYTH